MKAGTSYFYGFGLGHFPGIIALTNMQYINVSLLRQQVILFSTNAFFSTIKSSALFQCHHVPFHLLCKKDISLSCRERQNERSLPCSPEQLVTLGNSNDTFLPLTREGSVVHIYIFHRLLTNRNALSQQNDDVCKRRIMGDDDAGGV